MTTSERITTNETMNTEIETTIYLDDDSAIYIDAVLIPGLPARRDEYGAPESPDDEPEIEIIGAVDEDGKDYELTSKQKEEALEQLANQ